MNPLTRRNMVRLISYVTAAIAVLITFTAQTNYERERYRMQLEYTYMRALQDAADYVANIAAALEKGIYSGTPAQMSSISAALWRDASAAKASLAALPITSLELGNTYKFLAQVGDYSMSLVRKVGQDQQITPEERETLQKLHDYSGAMTQHLARMQYRLAAGEVTLEQLARAPQPGEDATGVPGNGENGGAEADSPLGFQEMEDSLAGYPSLIYDGPFSDHLLDRAPRMTQALPAADREQARGVAALAARVEAAALTDLPDEESKMPCYNFGSGELAVSVTKNGALINYLLDGRAIGDARVSIEEGRENALLYLVSIGLTKLRETYYEVQNGVLTINYAYYQDGVLCYTDLVKVGIALDNGDIVSLDARGYLMNHMPRTFEPAQLTAEQARARVSPLLETEKPRMALIPTPGQNDSLCYEFEAREKNGARLLVYINAQTGAEEQILKLIESENGVLVQ